ncbi:hypothetical protein K469DRAFT_718788 [Zopfia rhizophila CBS 207.26]|uniref:Calcineurin-like phosphoesterase domain-containing protein n=1 Tax=Zopfia rhizophila CBS 207.26 TaxID=1314779 RepID=A0A6A6ELX7_9PEZI|nr:hypothetical protein K469DRAFT_718788 [Zopfia rhizophila CBS 207.26]
MTHGPPFSKSPQYYLDVNGKNEHCCEKLAKVIHQTKPRLHCFGDLHERRGAVQEKWDDSDDAHINVPEVRPVEDYRAISRLKDISGMTTADKETLLVNAAMQDGKGEGC